MTATAQVYRCFDGDDRLLYIGVSMSPEFRLKAHSRKAPWFGDVRRVTVTEPMERKAAFAVERAAITAEQPIHNKQRHFVVLPPIEAAS
jgi:predicted GIY-YIG superfamily endonuclease